MDENIKIFIQELAKCEETYEIERWQLRVMTYLDEAFGNEMANKFQSLNINDNPWDGSARQRGYLEALVAKKSPPMKIFKLIKCQKKLTYDLFIRELDRLITSGETLYNLDQRDLDPKFRRWRLEMTDLIDRINKEGYSVRCSIRDRSFGMYMSYVTEAYLEEEYNRELQDTLNELSLIKRRYENFGEPHTIIIKKNETQGLEKVFLGHGRSLLWNRVHRFLKDELSLKVIDFETESRASSHIVDILKQFLDECNFAVIVMTAEDATADGQIRSRQNVIHEIGLFQGRHGFDRVLIFQQEKVEGFSNIAGLQTIKFKDKPEDGFYELRRALEKFQRANQVNAADS